MAAGPQPSGALDQASYSAPSVSHPLRSSDYLKRLIHPVAGVCVCGYQPNNHCKNGKVYEFSYCRDSNGQDCGTADVDTGNPC